MGSLKRKRGPEFVPLGGTPLPLTPPSQPPFSIPVGRQTPCTIKCVDVKGCTERHVRSTETRAQRSGAPTPNAQRFAKRWGAQRPAAQWSNAPAMRRLLFVPKYSLTHFLRKSFQRRVSFFDRVITRALVFMHVLYQGVLFLHCDFEGFPRRQSLVLLY
jgi:hypothetical protein